MQEFINAVKALFTSALKNASVNPKTTMMGIIGIINGARILATPESTAEDIAMGITSMLGGITLVLANDPKKENDQK